MKKNRRRASTIFLLISIAILIYCLYISVKSKKNNEDLFLFGYKPYIIQTGSMEPAIKVKALVIVKRGGYDKIEEGDIISFKMKDSNINVCHRAIQKEGDKIITKGDNNDARDLDTVSEQNYIGKVVFSTNVTAFIASVISSPLGIVKIVITLIAVIAIIVFTKMAFGKKGKRFK